MKGQRSWSAILFTLSHAAYIQNSRSNDHLKAIGMARNPVNWEAGEYPTTRQERNRDKEGTLKHKIMTYQKVYIYIYVTCKHIFKGDSLSPERNGPREKKIYNCHSRDNSASPSILPIATSQKREEKGNIHKYFPGFSIPLHPFFFFFFFSFLVFVAFIYPSREKFYQHS